MEENQAAVSLKRLREELGLTQAQLATAMDMTQSEVSRLEARDDAHVRTLRRVVEALGGHLELVAVVGKRRVRLSV